MVNVNSTSTDEFDTSLFRPHGRVEYEERAKLLCATAYGPFNMELMGALAEMARLVFPRMAKGGAWAHIAIFKYSALCPLDVLTELAKAMNEMLQLGIAPRVTAFVLPPDVEGASLMRPLYAEVFKSAGSNFESFQDFDTAHAWAQAALQRLEG